MYITRVIRRALIKVALGRRFPAAFLFRRLSNGESAICFSSSL